MISWIKSTNPNWECHMAFVDGFKLQVRPLLASQWQGFVERPDGQRMPIGEQNDLEDAKLACLWILENLK